MLKIWVGPVPKDWEDNYIIYAASQFVFDYEKSWITSDFGKEVIKGVDKSTVLSSSRIDSPVLGEITPLEIAGGTKALLYAKFTNYYINGCNMGDNCSKYLLKAAEDKDV